MTVRTSMLYSLLSII